MLKKVLFILTLMTFSLPQVVKPQSESEIVHSLFNFSSDLTETSTNIISLAVDAVWLASDLTGTATITGTLKQNANNLNYWSYTANPTDKLVVVFADNSSISFKFAKIDGYVDGTADDFKDSHTLDFTTVAGNYLNLRIVSNTGPNNGNTDWRRTITGSIVYNNSLNLNVNIQHNGSKNYDIGNGYAIFDYTESITGTATANGVSFTINDNFHSKQAHNSNAYQYAKDSEIWNNSSVQFNGNTYAFHNVDVFWIGGTQSLEDANNNFYNTVLEDYHWSVQGTLSKNGQSYGNVVFSEPVVSGTSGPYLIASLNSGGQILLHNLLNPVTTGVKKFNSITPENFTLSQNYPNPFNPETIINFSLAKNSNVKVEVFDVLGRKITTLVNREMSPGNYSVSFNAEQFNLSSGTYIYTLSAGSFYGVRKMVYLK